MTRQSNSNAYLITERRAVQPAAKDFSAKKTQTHHSTPASYTQLISLNGSFNTSDYAIMRSNIEPNSSMDVTGYLEPDSTNFDEPALDANTTCYLKDAATYQQSGRSDQDLFAIGSWTEKE